MRPRTILGLLASLVSMVPVGCQPAPEAAKDRLYDVRAKVVAVDRTENTVTLDHEDIPGYMKAMEMTFPVTNAKVLEGVKPGDQIQGKLKVRSGESVITELQKR